MEFGRGSNQRFINTAETIWSVNCAKLIATNRSLHCKRPFFWKIPIRYTNNSLGDALYDTIALER